MVSLKRCKVGGSLSPVLSEEEIRTLKYFQRFMRVTLYGTRNPVVQPDLRSPFFIAPLRNDEHGNKQFEWDLMSNLINFDEKCLQVEPDEQERKKMRFSRETYENAVVVPWYKKDISEPEVIRLTLSVISTSQEFRLLLSAFPFSLQLWCTVRLLEGRNAYSEFEDPVKFPTFEDYFAKKYKLYLHNPEFPLISVKALGKQLNFLTNKVDPKVLRKNIQRSNVTMLPELVNTHILPASLFVQGRYLPSILHRVYRLLVAREFREAVAEYFQWEVDEKVPLNGEQDEDMGR